ncbi:MAG: choice-of-anchor tandem repeat NxxGxxAF-containing protein [Planctomycetota bacterium]
MSTTLMIRIAYRFGLMGLAVSLLGSSTAAQLVRNVALTGDQAPGTQTGVEFGKSSGLFPALSLPTMNSVGQTAFHAELFSEDSETERHFGIWSEGTGELALVVRHGELLNGSLLGLPPPKTGSLHINDAGQTAFRATVTSDDDGTEVTNIAIWLDDNGSLTRILFAEDHPPDIPISASFASLSTSFSFNSAGQIAFRADTDSGPSNLTEGPDDNGVWSNATGALRAVAFTGSQTPETPVGVKFRFIRGPVFNDAGQTAFNAVVAGDGVDAADDTGIWKENLGDLTKVARTGEQAPGVPMGINFRSLGSPALNAAGQTAFIANLTGAFDSGIWSEGTGELSLVALAGEQAPGLHAGVDYKGFAFSPVLNRAGHTAFQGVLSGAAIDGTNNVGIWSEGSGTLELVAREGDQAPGTSGDTVFFGGNHSTFTELVLNSAGRVAFQGRLTGEGINSLNDKGLWAEDEARVLRLIVRQGDHLEVAPGDYRTIRNLGFIGNTGNEDGRPSGFNDYGQLSFWANFTDGTEGIFVSNLVAIPEPSSLLLGTIAVISLTFFRVNLPYIALGCSRR